MQFRRRRKMAARRRAGDHQFEPSWTLANFYFRAGKPRSSGPDPFRLEVSYGDRTLPSTSAGASPGRRGNSEPRHPGAIRSPPAYLVYLSQTRRLEAIPPPPAASPRIVTIPTCLFSSARPISCSRPRPSSLDLWKLTGQPAPSGIFNGDFLPSPESRLRLALHRIRRRHARQLKRALRTSDRLQRAAAGILPLLQQP